MKTLTLREFKYSALGHSGNGKSGFEPSTIYWIYLLILTTLDDFGSINMA